MKRRRTVAQWRRDVFKADADLLPYAVKVLLLYLADHMDENEHKVSVPRDTIAKALGVYKARVAERLSTAVKAEYLTRVSPGYPGRTSVYQATWPSAAAVGMRPAKTDALLTRSAVPIYRWAEREDSGMGPAPLDAIYEADLSVSPTNRHVGNDENAELLPVRSELPVCSCHGYIDCASLNREESTA